MEYNLYNLSSEEFEKLSKDILSVYLGKDFRTFSAGKMVVLILNKHQVIIES